MSISITCVDALNYYPTIKALKSTLNCVDVDKVYWFSDIPYPSRLDIDVQWIEIDRFKKYTEEYNYILLKLCPKFVETDYNIIIHSDGYAVNKDAWTDEFLNYDYIGAQWTWHENKKVGNGGFSLRSKKLYEALIDLNVPWKLDQFDSSIQSDSTKYVIDTFHDKVIPEDNIICRIYRKILENEYSVKFATEDVADRFSIEHNLSSSWLGKSLGFHGKHGVARHYNVEL